ncbi:cytidylate kinase [Firmicutes bacterium CAG:345]|nr:cytidylate kinase [Firmicutes bacterium CAG:345]
MKKLVVAIDGPAAAGKSTVAKMVAKKIGATYIDTGAMYRAVTYFALSQNIDPKDESAVVSLLPKLKLDIKEDERIFLNGTDVTKQIRSIEVNDNVSYVASYKDIRLALVDIQRKMSESISVVMDGRDIGTYVLPNADIKIFQVASVGTRALRRYKENISKGIQCELEDIEIGLKKRDHIDSTRTFAPLKPADDSIILDTSNLSIEEAVDAVIEIIKKKGYEVKNG